MDLNYAYTLWQWFQEIRAVLRFTPFETTTARGRSSERYRRAALTALASMVAKGASGLTLIVSIPLTLHYLGPEEFGLWVMIASFRGLLQFADLGVGNGLLNAISEASGREDSDSACRCVSSAFFTLLGIAVLVVAVFALLYPLVPWARVFNLHSEGAIREAGPTAFAFVVVLVLNLPLDTVQRVQMGYQQGYLTLLWKAAGSIMSLGGLLLAIHARSGLVWLVLGVSGGQLLSVLLNWIAEFGVSSPWLVPRWSRWNSTCAWNILGTGILFLILQLVCSVAFASDNLIIAQELGPQAVAQYAVPAGLFMSLGAGAAMFLTPLWPAYGEALARGDIEWVRRTLVRSLYLTLLMVGLPAVALVFGGKAVVRLWVGPEIQPSFVLLLGMGVWAVLSSVGSGLAMLLNGANMMRFQVALALPMAACSIVMKVFFAWKIGLAGIIWGMIAAYTIISLIPTVFYMPKLLAAKIPRLSESAQTL